MATKRDRATRQVDALQLVPQPARHRAGLEADTYGMRSALADHLGQGPRLGPSFALEHDAPGIVNHAHRGLFLRDV